MKIIVLNCGSSSIKYQLFDTSQNEVLAKGAVEKIQEARRATQVLMKEKIIPPAP